jgi:hypothetical protein
MFLSLFHAVFQAHPILLLRWAQKLWRVYNIVAPKQKKIEETQQQILKLHAFRAVLTPSPATIWHKRKLIASTFSSETLHKECCCIPDTLGMQRKECCITSQH